MPRFLIPKRSGVHRVACFALYRALLSQCTAVPLDDAQRTALSGLIRSQFRKYKEVQSPRVVTLALKAGYEALHILDAAVDGEQTSKLHIAKLVAELDTTKARKEPPTPTASALPDPEKRKRPKPLYRAPAPYPGATPTVDRPCLQISGRRHVPTLVSAGGFPFLRIKKPQPAFLSRMIRNKQKQRHRHFQQLQSLQGQCEMAELEDEWDRLLLRMHGVPAGADTVVDEPEWKWDVETCMKNTGMVLRMQEHKYVLMAARMQTIVNRERELAEVEKTQRRAQKRKARAGRPCAEAEQMSMSL